MDQKAEPNASKPSSTKKHAGGCHCGAVRFEATLDASQASSCNCSICTKIAPRTAIVKPAAFQLLSGSESLSMYEWGGKTGQRFFCKHCGIHCFGPGYLEEVGGDYVSVNLNALDDVDASEIKLVYFDGRHDNWQAGPRETPWPIAARAS
jgi:hypothetical protein